MWKVKIILSHISRFPKFLNLSFPRRFFIQRNRSEGEINKHSGSIVYIIVTISVSILIHVSLQVLTFMQDPASSVIQPAYATTQSVSVAFEILDHLPVSCAAVSHLNVCRCLCLPVDIFWRFFKYEILKCVDFIFHHFKLCSLSKSKVTACLTTYYLGIKNLNTNLPKNILNLKKSQLYKI